MRAKPIVLCSQQRTVSAGLIVCRHSAVLPLSDAVFYEFAKYAESDR